MNIQFSKSIVSALIYSFKSTDLILLKKIVTTNFLASTELVHVLL